VFLPRLCGIDIGRCESYQQWPRLPGILGNTGIIYLGDYKSNRKGEAFSRMLKEFEVIQGDYDTMDMPERAYKNEKASLGHMDPGCDHNQHPPAEVCTIFLQNRPSREM